MDCVVQPEGGKVQFADGQTITLPGMVELPIRIGDRHVQHTFRVMPTLRSQMLIGMDLWARFGYTIPAPPAIAEVSPKPAAAATEGLTRNTEAENRALRNFLDTEVKKFEAVRGPTHLAQHQIRVKPDTLGPPRVAQPRSEPAPAKTVGPLPPPPIPVEVEPGHMVNVPHFSAHVSRQYKTRSGGTKWHIRFNGNGTVRSVKRK
ncbi:hypothetical protein ALC60_13503 [Trachymyrmex zeteki]|uniref:Uncharacterized protein n=1 Tax=Mycetomoellerius zeteki TaxID=64791 RepID=A0A151WI05_9HYME|nr:hypothetical protein ALC60_13503 [Trachymyrmex zeteki]